MTYQERVIIRKIIHLSTGLLILILSYFLQKNVLLYLILAGTIFSFLTFNYKRFHLLHKTSDSSLGTLYYPIGILSSYLILYNLPLYYFHSSLMVLSISDTLAYFAGQIQNGNIWFRAFHDRKSIYGITVYAISACSIFYLFLPGTLTFNIFFILFALLWAVLFEIASIRGSDNLSIPAGLAIFFLITYQNEVDYLYLSALLLVLTPGCILLYKFHILTRRGSFLAFLLGFYFAGIKGLPWLVPILIFFLSSAAFTKVHHSIKGHGNDILSRNAWQVIANILWALISSALFFFTRNEIFILFFIVFLAAVTADTWASEIGPLLNKRCFSLSEMRMVPAGTNGGISLSGSLAALTGATIISSISYYLFFGHLEWFIISILSTSAFFACFADSLLGTFLEGRMLQMNYFRKRKTPESITPNDLVNMIGSLTAFVFYILLTWVLD
jgi:uncharacterized protein (TIGR00297 family)